MEKQMLILVDLWDLRGLAGSRSPRVRARHRLESDRRIVDMAVWDSR